MQVAEVGCPDDCMEHYCGSEISRVVLLSFKLISQVEQTVSMFQSPEIEVR